MSFSQRMVLVEDNPCIELAIRELLREREELSVESFRQGAPALQAILQRPPALVMLNLYLDGPMDGVELSYRIRTRCPVPLILLSGALPDHLPAHFWTLPKVLHLPKPFLPFQLHEILNCALK